MDSTNRRPRYVVEAKVRHVGFFTPTSSDPPPPPPATQTLIPTPTPTPTPTLTPMPVPVPAPAIDTPPLPPFSHGSNKLTSGSGGGGDAFCSESALGTSPSSLPSQNETENENGNVNGGGFLSIPSDDISLNPDTGEMARPLASSAAYSFHYLQQQQQQQQQQQKQQQQNVDPVGSPSSALGSQTRSLKEKTTKAERRAKQEAEREAKKAAKETGAVKVGGGEMGPKSSQPSKRDIPEKKSPLSEKKAGERGGLQKEKKKEVPPSQMQYDDPHRLAKARKHSLIEQTDTRNRVELFRHLPQFAHGTLLPSLGSKYFMDDISHPHPSVYQVGLRYITGDIVGGNARCVAMLLAFKELIKDYKTPKEKILIRDLSARVNSHVSFLIGCRPLAISMGNAIRFLKTRIANLSVNLSEVEAKVSLTADIDRFIQEKIVFADKEITKHAVGKIRDEDVLLTYGSSCIVEMILLHAFELGRQFRVIIVDSRPKFEGKGLLRRLLAQGINCTYAHINAVSYVMQEATRVFLGASSILANGAVYSRVGTACVAMVAKAFHIPVMVCCESYKFHERVQLDSICSNELGDPEALLKLPGRKEVKEIEGSPTNKHLQLLNLMYDATPADYVSVIVSELGMVPPTSVPVILREYRKELIL